MGSEGYLINQFIALADQSSRRRLGRHVSTTASASPVEIVRRTRAARRPETSSSSTGCRCSTWSRAAAPGTKSLRWPRQSKRRAPRIINTGVGWHEARIPTIATRVPRAAFAWVTRRLKGAVKIPLITTNRINDPEVAEAILARGDADMVSMARPFLADAEFVNKAGAGPRRRNQHLHRLQPGVPRPHLPAQDRVLPGQSVRLPRNRTRARADRHAEQGRRRRRRPGGHGLRRRRCRTRARGHAVRCGRRNRRPVQPRAPHSGQGGIRRDAALLPHAAGASSASKVAARTGASTRRDLRGFDQVVLATGITPRTPAIPGIDHAKVASYVEIVEGRSAAGAARRDHRRRRHRLRRRGIAHREHPPDGQ